MDPLLASLKVAASGLEAQSTRIRIVSENLANARSTGLGKARRLEGGLVRLQPGLRFLNLGRVGSTHDIEHQVAGGRNCHVLEPFR